jgi:multisubunit Na+/H+ antiporter MnhB subunit
MLAKAAPDLGVVDGEIEGEAVVLCAVVLDLDWLAVLLKRQVRR